MRRGFFALYKPRQRAQVLDAATVCRRVRKVLARGHGHKEALQNETRDLEGRGLADNQRRLVTPLEIQFVSPKALSM